MDNPTEPFIPDFVEHHLNDIAELCRVHGVARLELFGSATSNRFNVETSDIDFLISYRPDVDLGEWMENHHSLRDALQAMFDRKVDLIFDTPSRNPVFNRNVEATRRLIYAAED